VKGAIQPDSALSGRIAAEPVGMPAPVRCRINTCMHARGTLADVAAMSEDATPASQQHLASGTHPQTRTCHSARSRAIRALASERFAIGSCVWRAPVT
jgi:hypothetical protein